MRTLHHLPTDRSLMTEAVSEPVRSSFFLLLPKSLRPLELEGRAAGLKRLQETPVNRVSLIIRTRLTERTVNSQESRIRPGTQRPLPQGFEDQDVSHFDDDFRTLFWCIGRMSARQESLLREVRSLKREHQKSRAKWKRRHDIVSFSLLAVALGSFLGFLVLESEFLGLI